MGDETTPYGLSEAGEGFMAGIFNSYNAILHFLAPSPNSLKRLQPQKCVGSYCVWGLENRDAPLRLIAPAKSRGAVQHFEIKSMDHSANHFMAVALVIAAGVHGL